ncbi:MAG: class I SAM-dependent methyltransferase [Desulfobacterales bacterium]|nr:class I SAM-dependent methyltransferase [Desulfobacterales bacterium]
MFEITIQDFAESFGCDITDFSQACINSIKEKNFSYEVIEGKRRDDLILEILKRIDSDKQIIASEERKDIWYKGWEENLNLFNKSGCDIETLIPKFIRKNQIIRYNGSYILPKNPQFELDYITIFRTWLFQKYFNDVNTIYEFGCGTGFNLVLIESLFKNKELHGLDFVQSSVDLVNKIGSSYNCNIKGHLFDMIKPDFAFNLAEESAVFTFGAIEQLAGQFEEFLKFLLEKKPKLVIHIEPTVELYDENNLSDYLAIKFHKKRGYTTNYLPQLRELDSLKKLNLIKVKRLFFGSLFMEGYMLFIWQPV